MRLRVHSALIMLVALVAGSAAAQVFKVQGGASTLLSAEGGSVEFNGPNYTGNIGAGFFDGHFEYGAEARGKYHGYTVLAGDESIPFVLPTDVFDSSHYFSARGIGAMQKDADHAIYAFAGATSTWLGTGLFSAATSNNPVGIFFYERKLTDRLRFFSRDIVSNRQTALQGLEWKQNKWLKASLTSGIGSNQRYFASAVDAETQKFAFKASYVLMGDTFQRVTVLSPLSSEVDKGNVQLLYKVNQFVTLMTGHQNILEPIALGAAMQQATVNQMSADVHIERFYFGTGLFSSTTAGYSTQGTNFYGGRRFGRRLEANANYFKSTTRVPEIESSVAPQSSVIISGTVRENFSSRFSLLQLISRTSGETTYAFGGDYTSNRLMLRVDYQNVYLPFRPTKPYEQAMAVNGSFRVSGPWQVTVASNVAPDGHIRYAFGVSTYLYRINGMISNASAETFSIAKYVVQGVVKDDHGEPVEGAALHIGKQVAYTDSAGRFMVRFSKRTFFPLSVVPEEFINNGVFEVVSAPPQVKAESEEMASDFQVVVRLVPRHAATQRQ